MKIYLPKYTSHAGRWIYDGYLDAWKQLGYEQGAPTPPADGEEVTAYLLLPSEKETLNEEYIIMTTDALVQQGGPHAMETATRSHKTFVFTQPNIYPKPWGDHPNYQCIASDETIDTLNQMDNVYLWNFGETKKEHFFKWKEVHTIPLAFDPINYQPCKNDDYKKYDICFVGGWVNNGFNEKRKIMIEIFSEFMKTNLKCGFFVGKNLTHQQECDLLYNSRLTLNIHDAYQRILGNDTNERTFKSLGLNGVLVSDTVRQLNHLFPNLSTSLDAKGLVEITQNYLSLTEQELTDIREKNRQDILENHCYTNRIQQLLEL